MKYADLRCSLELQLESLARFWSSRFVYKFQPHSEGFGVQHAMCSSCGFTRVETCSKGTVNIFLSYFPVRSVSKLHQAEIRKDALHLLVSYDLLVRSVQAVLRILVQIVT